jgi:signal transduction histidine kinase
MSLRTRLVALVILSVVPLLAFSLASQYLQYRRAVAATSEQTLELARSIMHIVDQEMRARIARLEVLALSTRLRDDNIDGFRDRVEPIIVKQFRGANLILLRPDGQQLMNTLLAPGEKLPVRPNLESLQRVLASGQPAVSDLYMSPIGPRPVVTIDVPVKRADGSIAYVLSTNPLLEDFADILQRQRLPANRIVSLYDRSGNVIARVPNPEEFVGRPTAASQLALLSAQREGSYQATSREGIPVVAAFSHSDLLGWSVAVGVPREEVLAPALRAATRTLVAGGILVAISLALAFVVARHITRPITTLKRIAATADGNAAINAGPTGLAEADEVVRALGSAELVRRQIEQDKEQARAALHDSEQRLQQAQKMEAIGHLTGGLAHDFNNLLLVMIGNLEMLLDSPQADPALKGLALHAVEAAQRGADLTRSLLAFARRQPLMPQTVAINDLVHGIAKLLSRTLGERIVVRLDLAADLWPVVIDPAQLEAALANLATNARDAMPKGGRLTIATANRFLDEDYGRQHPEVAAGDYATIEVSDTGSGMAPDVIARIFDPFFTTKEPGKGTGLGLSMVFGFMKQSGGHINVYSEPDAGTTFRLYLPRDRNAAAREEPKAAETPTEGGSETILVVEDNPSLRQLVELQLASLRYRVRVCENADAALQVLDSGERIDLLFADIVMPGKADGYELVRIARKCWPSLKIVLTSGFPAASREQDTAEFDDVPLLTKPYRRSDLAQMVRRVLGGAAA